MNRIRTIIGILALTALLAARSVPECVARDLVLTAAEPLAHLQADLPVGQDARP